jgi:hypothetical protein
MPNYTLKKAFTLGRLGDDVQRPSRKTYQTRILDKEPLATFVFKYRSLGIHALFCLQTRGRTDAHADVLRANGIVPSNIAQKRRAITDSAPDNVKEEEKDDGVDAARMKALEVRSPLFGLLEIIPMAFARRNSRPFGKKLQDPKPKCMWRKESSWSQRVLCQAK